MAGEPGTRGGGVNRLAAQATTHCLIGCAFGEVAGMAIASALGWSNGVQLALATVLGCIFGFSLTALTLVRAGLDSRTVATTAVASDSLSIAIMEIIDNLTVVLIPGAYARASATGSST
jgi:hypothetical protein